MAFQKKVLIVEDSVTIAHMIKLLLESEGISAIHESDGSKVVNIVKREFIDLVLLDLMMPNISGYEVFKMLKSDVLTKNIPVIILTAKCDALSWDDSIKSCDKFMTKPFDNAELVSEIKKLL